MKFAAVVAIAVTAAVSATPVNMPRAGFTLQNGIDAKNLKCVAQSCCRCDPRDETSTRQR